MPTRDWAAIRRNLIAAYNPTVAAKFGASPSEDDQQKINLMQIQSNDSALIAQSRIALFNQKTVTPTSDSTDLVDLTVQVFDHCDENNQPVFNYQTIKVASGTESQAVLEFQRLAAIEAQQCSQQCYAAVPEWWQVRIEGTRPQLIFLFAEVLSGNNYGSPKYPISIPHPIDQSYTQSPIPAYQKGQYEGILTLKDNSKVIVNAISAAEAQKVIDAAKQIIIPDFLQGATQKIGNRSGVELLTINVAPKRAQYFPDGLKNTKPSEEGRRQEAEGRRFAIQCGLQTHTVLQATESEISVGGLNPWLPPVAQRVRAFRGRNKSLLPSALCPLPFLLKLINSNSDLFLLKRHI